MKFASVLVAACCVLSSTMTAQPRLDPQAVARQVRNAGRATSGPERPASDDGEFLIDTSATYLRASGDQYNAAAAFDGMNFLVVWGDGRNSSSDIYGARVTPDGTVLDPGGIVISQAAGAQGQPAAAFDGMSFLVVWGDGRDNTSDIYGARVTPDGTVLDPSGIAISQAGHDQNHPAAAFDGTGFLVVWDDGRSGELSDIYGARVTPEGTVLDPQGFVISQAAGWQEYPALGFDGANFLVVWENYRSGDTGDICGARLTPEGTVLDSFVISQAEHYQGQPAVAYDGTGFLVVWDDERSGSSEDIYGARVTPEGTVLDSAGIVISQAGYDQQHPDVAFDGTSFLVVWADGRNDPSDIYGARVTPQGTVLDPSGIAISQAARWQYSPALGFDGGNSLVVSSDSRISDLDIYGARVTPAGTVLDSTGFIVSQAVNWQDDPALGFDGANFLVVWMDNRSDGNVDIYGARVTPEGTVLDPEGFVVLQAGGTQAYPVLSFDGTNFLVAWQDNRGGYNICGARVAPQGTVLDTQGFAISAAAGDQVYPVIAFDGTNYLVVWEDWGSNYDICGARVTPQGTVLDPQGFVISSTEYHQQWFPAVSFDGTNYLVIWIDYYYGVHKILGTRVTPAGTLLGPQGFHISYGNYPALAFDGANFFAVWEHYGPGDTTDIFGARVTPAGTVLDPNGIAISQASGDQCLPVPAFDGENSLVVWEDHRNGDTSDIYGAALPSRRRQTGSRLLPLVLTARTSWWSGKTTATTPTPPTSTVRG